MTTHDETRPPPAPTDEHPTRTADPEGPTPPPAPLGTFADDFDLVRELGRGSFARVFLARQKSLGRLVAVKVSDRAAGSEGPVLAALDHPHIVRVFAEATDKQTGQFGLVLQYVSGAHLGEVLADVFRGGRRPTAGADLLAAIDRRAFDSVPFDPTALADRDVYRGGFPAVVCRLGAKLADALALAHTRGILHCDIKPSNVLLDRYGRPLLADFNVAVRVTADRPAGPTGGTLAYMAPEQLAAFAGVDETPPVGPSSDLYALGLVLAEALTGKPPPVGDPKADGLNLVLNMWAERRADVGDWLPAHHDLIPPEVWRVVRRCLAFDPAERFATAGELAAALRGAADLLDRRQAVPAPGRVARFIARSPLLALMLFTFLPHVVGSVVNITYNRLAIPFSSADTARFDTTTLVYNLIVYPLCAAAAVWVFGPVVKFLRTPAARVPAGTLDRLRTRVTRFGRWTAAVAAVGWFPGGLVFPLALTDWSEGPNWERFGHFAVSFTVSGLIAMTYSFLGVQAVVVRGLLPRLMHPEQSAAQRQADAHALTGDVGVAPLVAAAVPLTAAVVQVAVASGEMTVGFRGLVTGLIVLGMAGLGVAVWATQRLRTVVNVLCG